MTLIYLETSAMAKRYLDERGTDILDQLLDDRRQDESFTTSLMTVLEITAVAARLSKGRVLRPPARRELLAALYRDLTALFHVIPVDNALVTESMTVAARHALRAMDAFHLGTALRLRDALDPRDRLVMVSSDLELLAGAQAEGMIVLDPAAADVTRVLALLRS